MEYKDLKPGMIVYVKNIFIEEDVWSDEFVVVLPVTEKDIRRGVNGDKPGLYGFRGLWYKGNGTTHKSYGKIAYLMPDDDWKTEFTLIKPSLWGLSKKEISRIVDSPVWEMKQEFGIDD